MRKYVENNILIGEMPIDISAITKSLALIANVSE